MALQRVGADRAGLSGHREGALESLIPRARCYLYGVGLFSAVINILALTGSLFMLQIYDRVLPSGSVQTLVVLSLLAATLFAFFGLLDFFRGRVLVRLGSWFDAAISPIVYRTVVQLPLTNAPNKADPLRDLDAVRSFLSGPGPGVLFDLPWVPFYLGLIYLFHPWLAGLALVGMALLAGVMLITEVLTRRPTKLSIGVGLGPLIGIQKGPL